MIVNIGFSCKRRNENGRNPKTIQFFGIIVNGRYHMIIPSPRFILCQNNCRVVPIATLHQCVNQSGDYPLCLFDFCVGTIISIGKVHVIYSGKIVSTNISIINRQIFKMGLQWLIIIEAINSQCWYIIEQFYSLFWIHVFNPAIIFDIHLPWNSIFFQLIKKCFIYFKSFFWYIL